MRQRLLRRAGTGVTFAIALAFGACAEDAAETEPPCTPLASTSAGAGGATTTSAAGAGGGGAHAVPPEPSLEIETNTEGVPGNNFHHPMGESEVANQKNPFEILKERADEGPPEVRT